MCEGQVDFRSGIDIVQAVWVTDAGPGDNHLGQVRLGAAAFKPASAGGQGSGRGGMEGQGSGCERMRMRMATTTLMTMMTEWCGGAGLD